MIGSVLTLTTCAVVSLASLTIQESPDAREVLLEMAAYHQGVERAAFSYTTRLESVGEGIELRYWATFSVSLQKPDHLAIQPVAGIKPLSMIASADSFVLVVPGTDSYVELSPVDAVSDALTFGQDELGFLGYLLAGPGLRTLLAEDPASLFRSVAEKASYQGVEQVEGVSAHHIAIAEHHLWVAVGEVPRLLRAQAAVPDEWKDFGPLGEVEGTITTTVTDWSTPTSFPEDRFVFEPPADATEAESVWEALYGEDLAFEDEEWDEWEEEHAVVEDPEAYELIGLQAPRFQLEMLDGEAFDLETALAGHELVILDFWATWCPPCRAGLPILDEVAKEQAERGVAIFAVNLREDADTVRDFMEREGLSLPVLLDLEGAVAEKYSVTDIPQTVVIDTDGRVRIVHVGFDEGMKEGVREAIQAAFFDEVIEVYGDAGARFQLTEGLEQVWALAGSWEAVEVSEAGEIVVAGTLGSREAGIAPVGANGVLGEMVRVPMSLSRLRLAELDGDKASEYIAIGGKVVAYDDDGSELWTLLPSHTSARDVWAADLDGDGRSEVIAGYQGDGVRVHSADGELLWASDLIRQVYGVTAADLDGDGVLEAVIAAGDVHLFDGESGKMLWTLHSADFLFTVRPASWDGDLLFLACGNSVGEGVRPLCQDASGALRWHTRLVGRGSMYEVRAARTQPWAAATFKDGSLFIFHLETGDVLAYTETDSDHAAVAWCEVGAEPLLLVADGSALRALRVTPILAE